MNRFALMTILGLLPRLVFAQSYVTEASKENSPSTITKVIRVRYASPETISDLLRPGSQTIVVGNNSLKTVVVKGRPSDVAVTEQAVKDLDMPAPSDVARDIEVTVYILGATSKSESRANPPKEIAPVIKQLEGIFPYGNYELLDSMLIRSREGKQASTKGIMKGLAASQNSAPKPYSIFYDTEAGSPQASQRAVRFQRFQFHKNEDQGDIGFDTNFDVHEGQKVVVGKTNVDGGESALFVVLSARILD